MTRTHVLTERVAAVCPLSARDVEYLCDRHRTHVAVVPTGDRGRFRVTPAGYVGTILAPDSRLVLRPKIALDDLYALLDPSADVPPAVDRAGPDGDGALDFLAARLVRLVNERVAAGLHRGYAERRDDSPVLRGRLDVSRQLRTTRGRPVRFHSLQDDLTADVPENCVPKEALRLLLGAPLLGPSLRPPIQACLTAFAEVSPLDPSARRDPHLGTHRPPAEYGPLLDLCRLLLDAFAPGTVDDGPACPTFLLNMDRVFEGYVTRGVTAAFDDPAAVAVQRSFRIDRAGSRSEELLVRPDVTVLRDGVPIAVVDAKWKSPRRSARAGDDFYQMLGYCTALGVRRAVLVYPGSTDLVRRVRLARSPVVVEVRRLRVRGPRVESLRSLQRLGAAVARVRPPA
jgi:5-methylcytosine-specific restriction enzyme subunit McrC